MPTKYKDPIIKEEDIPKILIMGIEQASKEYSINKNYLYYLINKFFKERKYKFNVEQEKKENHKIKIENFEGVPIYKTVGAWTNSKEKKFMDQYKININQNEIINSSN